MRSLDGASGNHPDAGDDIHGVGAKTVMVVGLTMSTSGMVLPSVGLHHREVGGRRQADFASERRNESTRRLVAHIDRDGRNRRTRRERR